jgi:hypothetical protein
VLSCNRSPPVSREMKKLIGKIKSASPFSSSRHDAKVLYAGDPESKQEAARRIAEYCTYLGCLAFTEQVLNIKPFAVDAVMRWFDQRRVGLQKLEGVSRTRVRWIMHEPWKMTG